MKKKKHCLDCGGEISRRAKRCKSCAAKLRMAHIDISGEKHPFFGKHHSKETKEKIRKTREERKYKGKKASRYIDGRTLKKYYCKDCGTEISYNSSRCIKCYRKFNRGKNGSNFGNRYAKKCQNFCIGCGIEISKYAKRCYSCSMKLRWKDEKYREKALCAFFKTSNIKPNKKERLLNSILQKLLPKEYKLNVKANIMVLGRKIPDFVNVNGQKKVIELFGDYWHSKRITGRTKKQGENDRINYFKKFGFRTLIIWQSELRDINKVKTKMLEFNKKEGDLN